MYLRNYVLRRVCPAEYCFRKGGGLVDATGTLAGTMAVVFFRREYGIPASAGVIVDVGANMGAFSVFAALRCPAARILSYEPAGRNYEVLCNNLSLNRLDGRVKAFKLAVSSQAGMRSLAIGESPLNSLVMDVRSSFMQPVQCTTIEDIMAEHGVDRIDVLKMNCEGAEYEILEHCPERVLERVDRIRLEYHNLDRQQRNGKALERLLTAKGYRVNRFTQYRNVSGFIWADRLA